MVGKSGDLMDLLNLGPSTMAVSCTASPSEERRGIPWWTWISIIIAWLLLLLWWFKQLEEKLTTGERIEISIPSGIEEDEEEKPKPSVPSAPPSAQPAKSEDLKRIEGIGPKISSVLRAAGIATFAQLAAAKVARLEAILREAGIRIADPTTWPEQAALAARGEWEKLADLQDQLKGGRRV